MGAMFSLDTTWLLSVLAFATSMSATPGPNNAMVTASGATYGFSRTWPHMLGVSVGFPAMLVVLALGAGGLLTAYPVIHLVMKVLGAAYMLWLAWQIASAEPRVEGAADDKRGRPMRFYEAAAFQWINPKAWMIAFGALATYTAVGTDAVLGQVLWLSAIFFVAALLSLMLWTAIGTGAARLLGTARRIRIFNIVLAVLLVLSLLPLLWEH